MSDTLGILYELRACYSRFDERQAPYYRALSEAIETMHNLLKQRKGGKMDNTCWYRRSKDITLKNGKTVKIYQTVFETSDYSLSEDCVDWCMKAMDRKNAERRQE